MRLANGNVHRRHPALVFRTAQDRRVIGIGPPFTLVMLHARPGFARGFLALVKRTGASAGRAFADGAGVVLRVFRQPVKPRQRFLLRGVGRVIFDGHPDPQKGRGVFAQGDAFGNVIGFVQAGSGRAALDGFAAKHLRRMGRGQGLGIDQAFLPLGDRRLRSHPDEHGRARITVLARRANEFRLRQFTHQHRLAVTLALGPQPLIKAHRLQRHHRRSSIGRGIGHAVGADALHIIQRHGGVIRAKIHVHLAAIVALGKNRKVADFVRPRPLRRRPSRAAASAIGLDIPERG
ncbi:hypothetical protein D3C84_636350 [compost metagenome]